MKTTHALRLLLILLIAVSLVAACNHQGSGEGGTSSTGAGGSGGGEGLGGAPPLVTDPDATAMAISLSLDSDSSGTTPSKGSLVTLLFEPPSTAHLLALDTTTYATLGYDGTYSMTADSLTVSFDVSGFTRSGTISFDPTKTSLTLPFQVFSADKGTSSWTRYTPFVARNSQDLFDAISAESPMMSIADRASRVAAYAKHYVDVHADVAVQALRQGAQAPHHAKGAPWWVDPAIQSVVVGKDGSELIFTYTDGTQFTVILYNAVGNGPFQLTESPLASDPRATVAVKPISDADDPVNYTALFVAPFDSNHYFAYTPPLAGVSAGTVYGFHDAYQLPAMQAILQGDGYTTVTPLLDSAATVEAITAELVKSPGLVLFTTHGGSNGSLFTGEFLGVDIPGAGGVVEALNKVKARIKGEPGGEELVKAGGIGFGCTTRYIGWDLGEASACYVRLNPPYFAWLKSQMHANFSSSLVMIGACLTENNAALRGNIQAKAYFGYKVSIPAPFAGAVFQYFIKSLARQTHSAEESFYNVLRIANSQQIIYPEDALFQGVPPPDANGTKVIDAFYGHFPKGTATNAYQTNGWLHTPDANPGSIWLLLFAARGGGSATQGSKNLGVCWTGDWGAKTPTTGTVGTWCYNASPGYPAKEGEVGYANYLLTGQNGGIDGQPKVAMTVPRWTMNDGKQ